MIQNIQHPRKEIVPLAVGLAWGNGGEIYQEKLDGRFHVRALPCGNTLAGELMRGGNFIAWDCVEFNGTDCRGWGTLDRLNALELVCGQFNVPMVETSWSGGKLLETVLARGGEGIVRKLPGATYFDTMQACKRLGTWRCAVTAINYATGGASIADAITGENRGTVPLRNRAGQCRVGSIVKVEGLGLHAGGKIRDPRPCKDTATSWLVQF
jgi:hypothetical protein